MADIAQEAGLLPDESALQGAAKLFVFLWDEAWQHAEGTVAGDDEALHDMRVALRRLRSAMQNLDSAQPPIFPPHLSRELRQQRRKLGKLGDALGFVRDHDVLDNYLRDYAAQELKRPVSELPGLSHFEHFLQVERAKAVRPMIKKINRAGESKSFREEFARFALGIPGVARPDFQAPTLREAASSILPARVEDVLSLMPVLEDDNAHEAHHELRKSLRRTRYALETLSVCFASPVKAPIKTLTQMQDVLGEMQDRTVLHEAATRAFDGHDEDDLPEEVQQFLQFGFARQDQLLGEARALIAKAQGKGFFEKVAQL